MSGYEKFSALKGFQFLRGSLLRRDDNARAKHFNKGVMSGGHPQHKKGFNIKGDPSCVGITMQGQNISIKVSCRGTRHPQHRKSFNFKGDPSCVGMTMQGQNILIMVSCRGTRHPQQRKSSNFKGDPSCVGMTMQGENISIKVSCRCTEHP